ncbi:MAG: ABC transporter substrate-binding protein [Proteobacteria bacterium]|nr:ABC transporter substrate-binding protein [Pseudomonadota bacterium]
MKTIKKSLICVSLLLGVSGVLNASPKKVLLVTQIVDHPALDAVAAGAVDYLRSNGFSEGVLTIKQESAQGNLTTAAQIAKKFASEKPDAIVAISTPSAQTVVKAAGGKIPVVFGAITDPVSAKILPSGKEESATAEVTGVSDLPDFPDQLAFIKEVQPSVKTIGMLFNPGEANSVTALSLVEKAAAGLGLKVITQAVSKVTEVGQGATSLVGKVDAIYVANDNTVASGLEAAIKVCQKHKLPIYAADIMLVEKGLVGMRGYDYRDQGAQVGALVAKILTGAKAHALKVEHPEKTRLVLNPTAAEKLGIVLSKGLLQHGTIVGAKS